MTNYFGIFNERVTKDHHDFIIVMVFFIMNAVLLRLMDQRFQSLY